MDVLVISQVALSFILPFPILQMLAVAKRRDLMGEFANTRRVRVMGGVIAAAVIFLNLALLVLTFQAL
jgi:manganese transport protein